MPLLPDVVAPWFEAMHGAAERAAREQRWFETCLCLVPAMGSAHSYKLPNRARLTDARARRMAADARAEYVVLGGVFWVDEHLAPVTSVVGLPVEGMGEPSAAQVAGGAMALVTTVACRGGASYRRTSVLGEGQGGAVRVHPEPVTARLPSGDRLAGWLSSILPPEAGHRR